MDIGIEMHTHNDFGMAGKCHCRSKCEGDSCRCNRKWFRERAGNAALEEVVMSLKYLLNFDMGQKTQKLRDCVNMWQMLQIEMCRLGKQ